MSGPASERYLQLELPQTLFSACGAIFNLGTYYVAQWVLAMSLGQLNDYYLS